MTRHNYHLVSGDDIHTTTEALLANIESMLERLTEAIEQQHIAELVRVSEDTIIDRKTRMIWVMDYGTPRLQGKSMDSVGPGLMIDDSAVAGKLWNWLTNYSEKAT